MNTRPRSTSIATEQGSASAARLTHAIATTSRGTPGSRDPKIERCRIPTNSPPTGRLRRSPVECISAGRPAEDAPTIKPAFPICLPQMAPLYTREPPSARNSVRRTIVQLQRPSPQPTLTWNRPEPLLSGHFSDTAPHLCPFFASLRCTRPRVSLPAPAAPRSSAASRRRAAGSDDLPPAGASSIWRASPAAAGDSSATSA